MIAQLPIANKRHELSREDYQQQKSGMMTKK